jgi:hypothetical protein
MRDVGCVRVGLAVAILVGAASQSASAEVVSIRHGSFVFEGGAGVLDISGNRGFRLRVGVTIDGGRFEAFSQCSEFTPCPPGTTVNLDASWSGNDAQGTATLRGTAYNDVGAQDGDSAVSIGFSGSFTAPQMTDSPVTITVPFDFSGSFAYGLNGPEPQQALLSGGGHVTLTLRPSSDQSGWILERAVFAFSPVGTR